jgi:hypothetical protein
MRLPAVAIAVAFACGIPLVLRMHYGNETFLLPGDAEKQVEREE